MNKALVIIFLFFMIFASHSWSENPPLADHKEEAGHDGHGKGKDLADKHDDHGEEDHSDEETHSEENPNIGPDKGIVEADKNKGFKISSEAFKNFEIKTKVINDNNSFIIPKEAIFSGLLERNIYRFRNGFFKRVDFQTKGKNSTEIVASSSYLKPGDEIVISGLGFLRIVELAAYGGVSDSHSH